MAIFIQDDDAFERLARIEGEAWKKDQERNTTSAVGFFRFRERYREVLEQGTADQLPFLRIKVNGNTMIYGDGGYSRYSVLPTGEIIFSKNHGTPKTTQRAMEQGIRIE